MGPQATVKKQVTCTYQAQIQLQLISASKFSSSPINTASDYIPPAQFASN